MKKELTFYLIRHGRTQWNDAGLLQGMGDSPLTEQGILGAKATGKALSAVDFSMAFSSCLQRTIDTAGYIIGERDIPLFQHQGLNEHFFGTWEGADISELRKLEEFTVMQENPAEYKASNGGETFGELAERSMKAIQDIIKISQSGSNILIVSHGHTLRVLIALMNGISWQDHRQEGKSEPLRNTSINIVRYVQNTDESQGRFIVDTVNELSHLG
ncbi:putative phosphoglycerate mutase [Cricetibacter osteomyelitidis]|uniref:phosphoglycerate mutase (2,3-diphosphoglycerate-dependent) n=1 Tax=Cricetibacter osteomyelitidis TaxID=1521931 RepID=A0A4R2SRQ4_9PAST|nr:histidine phosphatase family protein [Cricetibacter osteomyelitidis]TCP92000.1 putative phosphoglycerate mutase [Cricetibacter osteomyelitidis]